MKPPTEPNREDCCNSGCNPCIFDVYEQQLVKYKQYIESGETLEGDISRNSISQLDYTTFNVVKFIEVCDQHIMLTFRHHNLDENLSNILFWRPGEHFLLKYSGNTSCTRAYTPIKDKSIQQGFSVIVKVYENGLVSNYLKNLKIGDITLWRGPYGHYKLIPNKYSRIIMIAQGTGIAPFISIIENILENENDMSKIFLNFCTKNDKTILFRENLYSFKEFWNFSYKIFLSEAINVKPKYQEPIITHKLKAEDIYLLSPFIVNKDQFLLCGSTNFMTNIKELLITDQNVSPEDIVLF